MAQCKEQKLIEQYITRIKTLVKDCVYENPDEIARDHFVFGINSDKAHVILLNEGRELILDSMIQIIQTHEHNQQQLKMMKNEVNAASDDSTQRHTDIHTKEKRNQQHYLESPE